MKVDMHVHTWWSRDAAINPDQLISTLKSKGIDAVVITDHDTSMFLEEVTNYKIIPGIEISTDLGHVLGFWFYGRYHSRKKMKFLDAVKLIRDNGGLVFLAHPFDGHRSFNLKNINDVLKSIDGIEVCNGKDKSNKAREVAREFAKWHDLLMSAGSDAHFPSEIGTAYVESGARTVDAFRRRFEKGDIHIVCGRQPRVSQAVSFVKSKLHEVTNYAGRPRAYWRT